MSRAIRALKWLTRALSLGALVGVLAGASSALFLWLLERATAARVAHPQLVFGLPIAGLALGAAYERVGQSVRGGNNLLIDRLADGGPQLPRRMAPLVLLGTVLTHLFGGSAGREGTAVQMGGSLADGLSHLLRCGPVLRRQLLAAGVAGGFGAVFGTPIAGCVFGLEVVAIGRLESQALLPALCAALVGDGVTRALGIMHTPFPEVASPALSPMLALKWLALSACVALVVRAFVLLTDGIKHTLERRVPRLGMRMALGGLVLVLLTLALGTDRYLGLGVPTIVQAFSDPALPRAAFAWKLVFTAITLGTGFLGGEVTPLFFVGACLGNALAPVLDLALPLVAAVALSATFGAAANTPLALSVMAAELFGIGVLPHALLVATLAYTLTGSHGIYGSQRLVRTKRGHLLASPRPLRDARQDLPEHEDAP